MNKCSNDVSIKIFIIPCLLSCIGFTCMGLCSIPSDISNITEQMRLYGVILGFICVYLSWLALIFSIIMDNSDKSRYSK